MADEPTKKRPPQGLPPLPPGVRMPGAAAPAQPPAAPRSEEPGKRIAELEAQLQAEREKVLLSNLKTQEEAVAAARVESAIKEVQDRLRRDRRDTEHEEARLRLEARVQELESRLVQERETWVATLKGQMATREVQDKEIETHFTSRVQEMERRWLEEKAHWQKVVFSKEEQIRSAGAAAERLKQLDLDHQRVLQEKRFLEERLGELNSSQIALQAKLSGALEREREFFQVKAELEKAREQARFLREPLEREIESLRAANKEREDRFRAEIDRLSRELATADDRARAASRVEFEAEITKSRAQAEHNGAALARMRAVGAALEKQVATLRAQLEETRRAKDESAKLNDRYKTEFLSLQRKWQEREAEIRKQATDEALRQTEADRVKLRVKASEELQARVRRVEEDIRRELSLEMAQREQALRERVEREVTERLSRQPGASEEWRKTLEAELTRKQDEMERRDQGWQERLLKKEAEVLQMRSALDESRVRALKGEEWKAVSARERVELEKKAAAMEAELAIQRRSAADLASRAAEAERSARAAAAERQDWERKLSAAQAAAQTPAKELEDLRAKLAASEKSAAEARTEAERLKAEAAKVEQTWRAKLDLERRELEERIKALTAERDRAASAQPSEGAVMALGRIKGLFSKKEDPKAP